jgi:hypothetical protein
LLAIIGALEAQLDTVDAELRRFARADQRWQALQSIYGIGPIVACHLLAEIARRAASAAPSRSPGWPGRRGVGRDEAPRPSREGGLAAPTLGTRGGRRAREPARRTRRCPLVDDPRTRGTRRLLKWNEQSSLLARLDNLPAITARRDRYG